MHFVIAGKINCNQFSFAVMVAQRLKENLPDFTYLKISMKSDEWEKWLIKTCKENQWYHVQSPIIWREIGLKGGKKEFIGSINKFLDICYEYYGMPREMIAGDKFTKEQMNWFRNRTESEFFETVKQEATKRRERRSRQVCITGAACQITEIVIMELLKIQLQAREDGLEIRLFDEPKKESKLTSSANDAKYCPGLSGFGNCRVANSLREALLNVDLVIVLDSFPRKPKESLVKWLKRNRNAMCALGKGLNMYAKVHCRVIIGSPSNQPVCYNANVLATFATKLHVRNIVVITQDLGREILKPLCSKIDVSLRNLYCPPVWGFVGLNKCIDVSRTLQTHEYRVPGKRHNSTLPQGTEEWEMRTIGCLIKENELSDINANVSNLKVDSFPQLGRLPCLAKATAIVDLLKVWGLKQEDGNGEILCLGVYSDGTFNIPQGLFWSQPVILKNGFWVPFRDYPIPRIYHFSGFFLFVCGLAALYRTKVRPRRYIPPKRIENKKKRKFDFESVAKGIEMPVIRTDDDCVKYLKYLAKVELGIDFDALDYDFEEESEPEVIGQPEKVFREELYCECWRNELRELQKIVFTRSSTTEVEVDLSENLSGSEWSVINKSDVCQAHVYESLMDRSSSESMPIQSLQLIPSLQTTSSGSTVCTCGALSNGSVCRCLGAKPPPEDNVSTEHFYKEQNAEIYQDEDLQNVIYADSYPDEKRVSFDPNETSDGKKIRAGNEFYGKKDAIRDVDAELKMKKRIMKYERGSRESSEGKFMKGEAETESSEGGDSVKEDAPKDGKFLISVQEASLEIIGDRTGLESLEMKRNEAETPSAKSFREMYADEIGPSIHVIPPGSEKSETTSERYSSYLGETYGRYGATFDASSSTTTEKEGHYNVSLATLENALDTIYNDELYMGESGGEYDREEVESEGEGPMRKESAGAEPKDVTTSGREPAKPEEVKKTKKEGISVCCLCRCILAEGLPCCPCGSTTVVEVFKKESVEIFLQSEEDISYKVEYKQKVVPRHRSGLEPSESAFDVEPREQEEISPSSELPPESFFPFSPKIPNEFLEPERPKELTKEYLDSLKPKPEREMPEKCIELLNMAKIKVEEDLIKTEMEFNKMDEETQKKFIETCTTDELPIKTDFSNLNMVMDGIEDWRLTVQMKYRQWFYEGPQIRDESYYDFAVEEISEDEFDVDKELEIYFEN